MLPIEFRLAPGHDKDGQSCAALLLITYVP
jgi:hypothetical protein